MERSVPPMAVVLVAADIYAQVAHWMRIGTNGSTSDADLSDLIDPLQAQRLEEDVIRPWLARCGGPSPGSPFGQVFRGLLYAGISSHALADATHDAAGRPSRRLGYWAGVKGQHLLYEGLLRLSLEERVFLLQQANSLAKPYPFAGDSLRGVLAMIRAVDAIRATGLDLGLRLGTIAEDQLCHTDLVITAHHHPDGGGVLVQVKSGGIGSAPEAVRTDTWRHWRVSQLPPGMRNDEYLAQVNTMYNEAYRRWSLDRKPWHGIVLRTDATPCPPDDPAQQVLTDRLRVLLMETGRFGPGVGMPTPPEELP